MATPIRVERYGRQVFEDPLADAMRRELCLCLRCDNAGACETASQLYGICRIEGMAMAITRCASWTPQRPGR